MTPYPCAWHMSRFGGGREVGDPHGALAGGGSGETLGDGAPAGAESSPSLGGGGTGSSWVGGSRLPGPHPGAAVGPALKP